MGTEPDELKAEVEGTRARLAHDVDRLADKVAPGKVARRKAGAAQHRLTGLKERVMGVTDGTPTARAGQKAQDLAGSAGDAAGQAGDAARQTADQVGQAVREAPAQLTRQTQGSPLAAGVIAFGAGMLAAALLPASEAEERAGAKLREHSDELLGPARQTAQDAAQEIKEGMREPATDAVESVKSTAQEAARATGRQVQDSGRDAASGLRDVGRDAVQETRDQAGSRPR
ncbi:DUF3618 domain-containing protein [uncultured Streptomyces sp.]|uniref:DUF3618 domain-containing protein n=1 Tax=uncultured Streptomyces sp. TaxID=174707 RepID=UPI00261D0342|nr:DUF3618 domain-containing protein [uncultured Streptomyces sp.]